MRREEEIRLRIKELERLAKEEIRAERLYSAEAITQQIYSLNWVLGKLDFPGA